MIEQENQIFMVVRHEPIESMPLPPGWFEDHPQSGPLPGAYTRTFRNLDHYTTELTIFFRGQPIDEDSCESLMRILSERPQILTKSKANQMRNVLGNAGHDTIFRQLMLRTETFSGRNVLSVEGRWSSDEDAYIIYFPESPGSNRIIELQYQAPKEEFRKNLAVMKKCFSAIKWFKWSD